MARRRLTLRRIDPWSVLKFGFVTNLSLLLIFLLGFGVLWVAVRQLGLIEQACELALRVGFVECGINGGNLFRALLLLGLLGSVAMTGILVFLAFLHNLIADLVGGLSFTLTEDAPLGRGAVTGSAGRFPAATPGRPGTTRTGSPGRDRLRAEPPVGTRPAVAPPPEREPRDTGTWSVPGAARVAGRAARRGAGRHADLEQPDLERPERPVVDSPGASPPGADEPAYDDLFGSRSGPAGS